MNKMTKTNLLKKKINLTIPKKEEEEDTSICVHVL